MKDALKTLYVTVKAQFFAGFLLAMLSLVVWRDLPTVEHWALRKFVQWQQRHETKLMPETVIVGIDDESLPLLEKRFKASYYTEPFYLKMMGDLSALHVPHVVLNINTAKYMDTQSVKWPYRNLRVSQAFTAQQMAGLPVLLNYDHIGIKKNTATQYLNKENLLYPLVYKAGAIPTKNLFRHSVEYYPSIALSGVIERFNSNTSANKAFWNVSREEQGGLKSSLVLNLKHDDIKNMQKLTVKMDEAGEVLLRWYQNRGFFYGSGYSTRKIIKASDLYKTNNLEALTALQGHTVVLTDLTKAGMHVEPSVLSPKHLKADIIATAIDNVVQGQSIYPAPPTFDKLLTLAMAVFCFVLRIAVRRPVVPTILLLLSVSGYATLSFIMPYYFDTLLPFVSPIAGGIGGFFLAEFFWRFVYEKDLRNLELNMTQLVSQSVLKEVQTKKTRLEAGGKRLNISSMFVDIRNFTHLSENLSPMEVTEILNVWYTEVEHVANEYRGTVDKFLGDGALVMFGAPMESSQHADMALRAARHMIRSSEEIAAKWRTERNIEFSVGVSINSGYAFVGFIGPKNKLEYTAIGDTINTSSRLQDATKRFHTKIIFSESTLKQCVNIDFEAKIENLGNYKVRGKEVSISTYTFDDMYIEGYNLHKAINEYQRSEKETASPMLELKTATIIKSVLENEAPALSNPGVGLDAQSSQQKPSEPQRDALPAVFLSGVAEPPDPLYLPTLESHTNASSMLYVETESDDWNVSVLGLNSGEEEATALQPSHVENIASPSPVAHVFTQPSNPLKSGTKATFAAQASKALPSQKHPFSLPKLNTLHKPLTQGSSIRHQQAPPSDAT
jgi:class 3 adenylate cyclase